MGKCRFLGPFFVGRTSILRWFKGSRFVKFRVYVSKLGLGLNVCWLFFCCTSSYGG